MTKQVQLATDNFRGPQGYENWRKALQGLPARSGEEIQLYSDAHVTAEITEGWGPYQALNTIGVAYQQACVPVLVLRTAYHLAPGDDQIPDMENTDTTSYHGGGIAEEVSALIGLALGIRLRPGGKTRDIDFDPPRERPRAEDPGSIPILVLAPRRPPVLPNMQKTVKLHHTILAGYPDLPPRSAVAVVRAARLYQHGLWLSESNPNDAWLMFISAAEVAAVQWRAAEVDDDPETLFRQLKPAWAERLDRTGDSSLVRDMAILWADLLGSTNRFLKFLRTHLPDAPAERPPVGQVDWSSKGIRAGLEQIYEYRSLALHAGIPFPAPMCLPPFSVSHENKAPIERPLGLATASSGGVWKYEDIPMHLHIFAYIVRGALMKWWECLKSGKEQTLSE
jgi:hypothetical protein